MDSPQDTIQLSPSQVHLQERTLEGLCRDDSVDTSAPVRFRKLVRDLEAEFDRLYLANQWLTKGIDEPRIGGDVCLDERHQIQNASRSKEDRMRVQADSPGRTFLRPTKEHIQPPSGDVVIEREVTEEWRSCSSAATNGRPSSGSHVRLSTGSMVTSGSMVKLKEETSAPAPGVVPWQLLCSREPHRIRRSSVRQCASVIVDDESGRVARFHTLKEQFDRLHQEGKEHLPAVFCHGLCSHLPSPPSLKAVAESLQAVRRMHAMASIDQTQRTTRLGSAADPSRAVTDYGSFRSSWCQPIASPMSMAEINTTAMDFDDFIFVTEGLFEVPGFSNENRRVLGTLRKAFKEEHHHHVLKETREHLELREKEREEPTLTGIPGTLLDVLPSLVIFLNSLALGLSVEIDAADFWEVLEYFFTGFYVLEFIIKIHCFGCRVYFLGQQRYWNWFDFACLLVALGDLITMLCIKALGGGDVDLHGFMLLKILRLARIARLIRALHFGVFKELKAMVVGVVSGLRVLGWAIVLLMTCIYAISVALTRIMHEEPEFASMPGAMFTVFRCFTDGCVADDGTPLHERLRRRWGPLFFIGYILLFMFVTVGVFNLIMAVFIDNVVSASTHRKQQELSESSARMENRIKVVLKGLLGREKARTNVERPVLKKQGAVGLDEVFHLAEILQRNLGLGGDEPGGTTTDRELAAVAASTTITRDIFQMWFQDPDFIQLLEECDIESSNKGDLFDVLDVDMGGELTVNELVGGLMRLRGPITKSDIVAVRLKTSYVTSMVEELWRIIVNREKPHTYGWDEADFDYPPS